MAWRQQVLCLISAATATLVDWSLGLLLICVLAGVYIWTTRISYRDAGVGSQPTPTLSEE